MRTLRRLIPFAAALALACTLVTPAFAAGVTAPAPASTAASTPVDASAGGPIEIQVWPGQDGRTAVISAVAIDSSVKLPAKVRIPVVPGTSVEWAGEIVGTSVAGDIEQPFTLVQGRGGQFAEFTLTKSHRGQIDALGVPLKLVGDTVTVSVDYVQSVDSTLTTIAVRIPANTSKVKISPEPVGNPVTNVDGESLYTLNPASMKRGDKLTIGISYSTVPPVEPAPGSNLNPVLLVLIAALLVAVVAMVVIVRRNAANPPEGEQEDADDEEDDANAEAGDEAAATTEASDDAWID